MSVYFLPILSQSGFLMGRIIPISDKNVSTLLNCFGVSIYTLTSTIDGVIEGASVLLKRGVKNIIVTLGERGALLLNKDECALVSAYNVNPIDTVAAGDSFNGAFITSLSKGKSIIESIKFANAMGALTTLKKGAIPSLHNEKEVEEFINSNEQLKVIKMR